MEIQKEIKIEDLLDKKIDELDEIFVWKQTSIKNLLQTCSCCGSKKLMNRILCRTCLNSKKENFYNLGRNNLEKDLENLKMSATSLLAKFNNGTLLASNIREHRQEITKLLISLQEKTEGTKE